MYTSCGKMLGGNGTAVQITKGTISKPGGQFLVRRTIARRL